MPYKPTARRCTEIYKIEVLRRLLRQHYGWPLRVDQYLGISRDEIIRIKESRVQYISNNYPLVETGWTRGDCERYLAREWPDLKVGRSACYFCPYHSPQEWTNIADKAPDLYQKAPELEEALAKLNPPQRLGKTTSIKSMVEEVRSQMPLALDLAGDDCSGHCFT